MSQRERVSTLSTGYRGVEMERGLSARHRDMCHQHRWEVDSDQVCVRRQDEACVRDAKMKGVTAHQPLPRKTQTHQTSNLERSNTSQRQAPTKRPPSALELSSRGFGVAGAGGQREVRCGVVRSRESRLVPTRLEQGWPDSSRRVCGG